MKIRIVLLGLFIAASASMSVKASGDVFRAEALFIYNFLRHVNYPENNRSTLVIGVYGDCHVYDHLQVVMKNRKIGSQSIAVKKITSAQEARSCQLVFVPDNQSKHISSLNSQLVNSSCLVVGEREGSNAMGSTIEFLVQDNKLRFRVNEEKARQQKLVFSKTLIDMAI